MSSRIPLKIGFKRLPSHGISLSKHYHYLEFAPTVLILILFPVLIAGAAVLAHALDALFHDTTEFAAIRPYFVVAMLGTLGVLVSSQMLLIVAN